jgi:ABC-type polysaccharide transport system permease subunit
MGYGSIIYISALSGIPVELHEAAIVDGASILKRIWHVDLPGVLPTVCILLIMRCGDILDVGFEKIMLLQNSLNKPISDVISVYTYNMGINSNMPQYSYASAIGLFSNVINMLMLLLANTIVNKINGNGLF